MGRERARGSDRWSWRAGVLALAFALAACGSPDGGPPVEDCAVRESFAGDPFFDGRESYSADASDGACFVSLDRFKELSEQDGFVWASPSDAATQAEIAAARYAADLATAAELIAERPELAWLLELPEEADDLERLPSGEYLLTIDDSVHPPVQVLLQSHAESLASYLGALAQAETAENEWINYQRAFEAAPEAVKADLATPESLASADLTELLAASVALEAALEEDLVANAAARVATIEAMRLSAASVAPDGVALSFVGDYRPPGYTSDPRFEAGAGPGSDRTDRRHGARVRDTPCEYHSDGLQSLTWWPQQHYQTSIKEQGQRGSCVAFALVSAIESNVAIRTNQWVNLSEQRLYYEMKAVWDPKEYGDGFNTWKAAKELAGFGVPYEQTWPYNPSWQRVDDEDWETYQASCPLYSRYPYACSDTTHQGGMVCTGNISYYCGYAPEPRAGDAGFRLVGAHVAWSPLKGSLPIHTIRTTLDAGYPMVVSLEVDSSFRTPTQSGFVSHNTGEKKGGHAVHLVGFVSNVELMLLPNLPTHIKNRAAISGGGFFVLKNSWGCGGDGGYWYVPVEWAKSRFKSIVAFDRGHAPNYGVTPPSIKVTAPAQNASFPASPLLDVTFTAEVSDARDGNACCDVQWRSDVDGPLGSGKSITVSFATAAPGQRMVTATATNAAGMKRSAFVTIVLTSQGPNVSITSPPKASPSTTVYLGLATSFAAEEFAPVTGGQPCSSYTWTSNRNGEGPWSGCSVPITFTTTGPRTIRVEVPDEHGTVGSDTIAVNVVEPASTDPPVVSILRPLPDSVHMEGDRATLDFAIIDPAGSTPTFSDVVWEIRAPGGAFQTITVRSSVRVRPGQDPVTVRYFVPSDYVVPRCSVTMNPAWRSTVRLSFTNELGQTGSREVLIYVGLPPSSCVN